MKPVLSTLLASLVTFMLMACAPSAPSPTANTPTAPKQPTEVTLVTHDSFDASEAIIQQFEKETGLQLNILKAGDAGEMLNTLLLSKDAPLGDVVYGIDNTFLSRALEGDLFMAYEAPALADIPEQFKLDPENRLLPVDYGYVTINYDIKWFEEKGIAPPKDIEDLIKPAYKGLTVVENPASSSPGLAFMFITIGRFGLEDNAWLDYWRQLKVNDVLVTDGWSDAYFGQFSVGSGGEGNRPIVVSYATSPAAEVFFNELTEPPTASINTPGNSFEQIEFVGILAKSSNQEAARKLVDFLLSPSFQEDIPTHMWVYPTNSKASVGELFQKWAEVPEDPIRLAPEDIAANRESWIEAWTDVMLRE